MLAFGGNPVGIVAATVVVAVDTPLSLVGDVVTLPYVLVRTRSDSSAPSIRETPTKASSDFPIVPSRSSPDNAAILQVDRKSDAR